MRNRIQKFLVAAMLLLGFAGIASAQTSLAQTTLSSAVSVGPSGAQSGQASGSYQTLVTIASGTGVNLAINGQPTTLIYVGSELMGILTNPTGTTYSVLRGLQGTKIAPHPSGDMVLLETSVSPSLGGFSGSGGFQNNDPPLNGQCTGTNTLVTPWVNVQTGAQWICSSITTTWVPGFNNPLATQTPEVTTAVASVAGTTTPSGPFFHITGTNAITAWGIPIGCNATAVGGCQFTVIPDAAFTATATNNIATALTAVANLPITFRWDATNSKFVSQQSK
jgi:hypothetical protein